MDVGLGTGAGTRVEMSSTRRRVDDSPLAYRWWDLPAAVLLLAALFTAASRLIITDWVEHLNILHLWTFCGALAGLALGQSRFSPRRVILFALSYGLFIIFWRLGLTLECDIDVLWTERLVILASRLTGALGQLARREAVQDPLLFLLWMAALFWALSVHAGYTLTRHAHPWRATLPTALTLLIIQNSDPYETARIWSLAAYLFFSLLLLARLTYLRHRVRWQQTRARIPPLAALDFTQAVLLASVLLILLAWLIPVLTDALPAVRDKWQETTRPWFTAVRDVLDRAFASLRRTAVLTVADHYGDSLSLSRGSQLTDALVLTVQGPPSSGTSRYYWRARVYDHYAGGRWSSVAYSVTRSLDPTDPGLTFADDVELSAGRRTITFTFTSAVPMATLYAASQPRWVSLPAQADLAHHPDGSADLAVLRVAPPLRAGDTYQARSSLCTVTVAQLRAAGTDYPAWVTDRYLQLPPTITPRTWELARRIAAGMDNPYDIAAAVTGYLRATIRYTETIPAPPVDEEGGQEPLDWFLFDLQQGFCNYYASAEVILLRSLGIPARLAVGFAEGERQDWSNAYLVRQRDAHAWPEVYFPGLGWVEFEPTVSQSPINRPLGESRPDTASAGFTTPPGEDITGDLNDELDKLLAADEDMLAEPSSTAATSSGKIAVFWIALLALASISVAFLYRSRRRGGLPPLPVLLEAGYRRFDLQPPAVLRRWTIRASLSPLARAYQELNRALARLGDSPAPAATPAERAAALTRLLPAAAEPAQQLVAEYHIAVYSPRSGDHYVARQAGRTIRRLSWRAGVWDRMVGGIKGLITGKS